MRFLFSFCLIIGLLLTSCNPQRQVILNNKDGGALFYVDGEPSRWRRTAFPITLRIPVDQFEDYEAVALGDAIVAWEDAVGYQLFTVEWTTSNDPMILGDNWELDTIIVNKRNLGKNGEGMKIYGLAWPIPWELFNYFLLSGRIELDYSLRTHDQLERVFAHELGHMLGLAHDPDDQKSIMYNYTVVVGGEVFIQDPDVAFVRSQLPLDYDKVYSCKEDSRRQYCPQL